MWLQICAFECSTSDGLPRWLTQFSAPNVGRISSPSATGGSRYPSLWPNICGII